ncbi:A disintegrin and metalloproteinase with thrombospondin motifs 16 isoform X1 [Drosophila sulfurigaster albostrigata]|uniref:A disintegrin and metalloproteinase with thrombospondin motifs 16 isoform X1 n=1 Tax=Drosophila sulfurigaster albostrigata TaxID=89887 RepID=UPI002D218330|nr:A disintegrin and metalloproteinase with thrombospondin motifs 16 isoform X1 [Drosophila sulfurigaster albostrigata]
MSAPAANQRQRKRLQSSLTAKSHCYRHRHRLCLIVLAATIAVAVAAAVDVDADAVHIELRRRRSVNWNGIELDENALLEQLAGHERALIFGSKSVPEFKLVHLARSSAQHEKEQQPLRGEGRRERKRRSAGQANEAVEEDADVKLQLPLQQTPQLIDDAFIFIRRTANSTQFVDHSPQLLQRLERCFYRSPWAALDLCDEQSVRGVFQQNASNFVIQPLPARFGPAAHVLYQARLDKSRSENNNNETTPLDTQLQFEPDAAEFNEPWHPQHQQQHQHQHQQQLPHQRQHLHRKSQSQLRLRYHPRHHHHGNGIPNSSGSSSTSQRLRRHIGGMPPRRWPVPHELHIETAIFVDSDLYRHMEKNFPKDTESQLIRFVLAMINGVQLLYHHPTLGRRINFVLKRLEIFRKDPPELRRSSDIDTYLSNFCLWQKSLNPPSDADSLHYDHAVILTGLDLYVIGKNGKVISQVVGLAPVAGMCTATSSCTINEGKHFESVFVVAHEIGHNLGMRHDTKESSCDPSLHIMSPTLGSGKITWSKCSRTYLEEFLAQGQADCLFDRGQFKAHLDHSAEGMLPGERFDANQQCMLKYGQSSVRATSQSKLEICHDLHCQRERLTWTSHPALEGTECGDSMWCRGGYCVQRPTQETAMSSLKQLSGLVKPSYEKNSASFAESSKMGQFLHEYKTSTWSDWGEASECDSGCLYGPSHRLREGSTGLRTYNRNCLNYRSRCMGRDRKFETCIAKQCYSVPVQTIGDFATQVCMQARKSDSELTGEGQQLSGSIEDSCKVFCRTRSNGTKSRRWTFPDGTICRAKHHGPDDIAYCISGRCEQFSCDNATSNFFKMDNTFCAYRTTQRPQRDSNELESKQQPSYHNNVSYKRYADRLDGLNSRNRYENEVALRNFHGQDNHISPQQPSKRKVSSSSHEYKYNYNQPDSYAKSAPPPVSASLVVESAEPASEWQVISGCHSNCMTESMGVQVVSSRRTQERNVQLCTHKVKPCERLQTPAEYAEQTCARYKQKVRGLSGHGSQISASIEEPDRSCRVGCQDEFITYRYYLVNGKNGHFPIGTRCSQVDRRYCLYGKCLEFGTDNMLKQQSHISLALFRSKRDLQRQKRSFLYFDPVNITETITKPLLNNLVSSIFDFEQQQHLDFTHDNIELSNPIHVSTDELSSN